jgi:hypothetical protein
MHPVPRPRIVAALLAGLSAGAVVRAQSTTPDSTVAISLTWSEVGADNLPVPNPNGLLEPGERALLRMSESFSNQNTIGHFSPPVGTFSQGTIRGFGTAFLDLYGLGGAQRSWNVDTLQGFGVNPMWDLAEGEGTPSLGGALLTDIQFGQFPLQFIATQNPVPSIWTGVWTPESFGARTVQFGLAGNPAVGRYVTSVILTVNRNFAAVAFCAHELGSVSIPVVPAPGAAPALCLATAGFSARRRRIR